MYYLIALLSSYFIYSLCLDARTLKRCPEYRVTFGIKKILSYLLGVPVYLYSIINPTTNHASFLFTLALFITICVCTILTCICCNAHTEYLSTLFFITTVFAVLFYHHSSSKTVFAVPVALGISSAILLVQYQKRKRCDRNVFIE